MTVGIMALFVMFLRCSVALTFSSVAAVVIIVYSRRRDLVRYISSRGYDPLRTALAAHLHTERGLQCRPQQIVANHLALIL